ncbi:MAG: serine hydrolase [Ignavibacteria bacterium]|nr:serine hydrolase [Ignavibacteria bacterium]
MAKLLFILLILIIIIFNDKAVSQFNEDSLHIRINRIVKQYVDSNKAGMVVGVIRKQGNNTLNRRYSFGHVRRDSTSPVPDSLTIFHIGSVTKTYSATILSMLIQNGGPLRLNDLVEDHLPLNTVRAPYYVTPGNDTVKMTILDLATHYSALPDDPIQPVNDSTTYQMMYNYLNNHRLSREPGRCFLYSNLGVSLLGVVLTHTLGNIIDSLFIQRISNPLQMPDTRITLNQAQLNRRATGYAVNGDSVGYFKNSWPAFYAAGGLYTTLSDFMRYLEFNMGLNNHGMQNVLDSAHKIRRVNNDTCREENSKARVGLVWQMGILDAQVDSTFYYTWKDGGVPGFVSFICFADNEKEDLQTGVVMITNQSIPCGKMANEILRYINLENSTGINQVSSEVPQDFKVHQNYPNPFNPSTKIRFEIPQSSQVKLNIYDNSGKLLESLINQNLSEGIYEVQWNATDFASGIYFYQFEAGSFMRSGKMILVK